MYLSKLLFHTRKDIKNIYYGTAACDSMRSYIDVLYLL